MHVVRGVGCCVELKLQPCNCSATSRVSGAASMMLKLELDTWFNDKLTSDYTMPLVRQVRSCKLWIQRFCCIQ
jgi:hypothetical protein